MIIFLVRRRQARRGPPGPPAPGRGADADPGAVPGRGGGAGPDAGTGRGPGRPQARPAAADRDADAARPGLAEHLLDEAHRTWIAAQSFGEPALTTALAHYRATLDTRETELACIESELAPWARREPLAPAVARLCCYRGIAALTALTLAAEVVDWRRFPSARAFMGYTGLVPSEYSSGARTWRGHITKAGSGPVRTALIEAAWAYRFQPAIGVTLRRRQEGAAPDTIARSWKAQRRLHGKYRRMINGGKAARRRPPRSPASWPGSSGPR